MTAAFRLGPLGGLREVPLVQRGVSVQSSRSESIFVTLGGRRVVQRSPRAVRDWSMSLGQWRTPADVAYLAACADGSIPGPLYLHTQDAALSNLLPSDVAAPCRMGTVALGSVSGTVSVGMGGGAVPSSGVVQQASVGAWSAVVPVRQVSHVLSAWASAAGVAVEWRTVTAAGVQVASGAVTAVAVSGGFYGAVSIVPGATVAGVQVRLAAGSRTVGGLRLVEGVLPEGGVEMRRNFAMNACRGVDSSAVQPTRGVKSVGGTAPDGFSRVTISDASLIDLGQRLVLSNANAVPVVAGETISLAAQGRASAAASMKVLIQFQDANRSQVSQTTGAVTTVNATTFVDLGAVSATVPANAVWAVWWVGIHGVDARATGDTLDVRRITFEKTATPGPNFDGSTSPDPALLPFWTGPLNASPSVLKTIPEGAVWPGWAPGVGVPQVVVGDPQQTLQLATATETLSDYAITLREVG